MKITQKNDKGEDVEVEVFSQAEIDAKIAEKESEFNTKIAEKDTAIATMTTEKADLEKKLAEIKPDHPNFAALKEALDKKDAAIKSVKDELDQDKQNRVKEAMDTKITAASKGDAEFEKKVRLALTNTLKGLPETTEAERTAKIEAAVKLSTDFSSDQGMFDGGIGGGGRGGDGGGGDNQVEFTPREKSLGSKLGITDEDYKKYGSRLVNKKK